MLHILVIDPSKPACNEMTRYLRELGHASIAVNRAEDAADTLAASLAWEDQFDAIIITADLPRRNHVLWFLRYLNNRRSEYGVIPCLLQSEDPIYQSEGDRVDLRTLSNRQFPFIWYHPINFKKMGYFQRFFRERVREKKGPAR